MPEVEYTTSMSLPREEIWEFIKDMNNWAPFLTGYKQHEILSETDSIWTLKGDVGILSRVVRLKAHITEWDGPQRVAFTLTGLNEMVEGGGVLSMQPAGADSAAAAEQAALAPPPRRGLLWRLIERLTRWFLRRADSQKGNHPRRLPAPAKASSHLTFKLRMEAGGPTGPLVNAMLAPALLPAAEDLANKIAAHLEAKTGAGANK